MSDMQAIRLAALRGISIDEADAMIEASHRRNHARAVARRAAEAAEAKAIAGLPISEQTSARIAKRLAKNLTKPQRGQIAAIVGMPMWNRLANPQTREAAIAELDETTGRLIA